jgi:hypothetical protein
LITKEDVQKVLGGVVAEPEASDNGIFRNCIYTAGDKAVTLDLEARDIGQDVFQRGMKLTPPHGPAVDPSLGADAYTDPSSGTLLMWKNGVTLNILVSDRSGKRSKANRAQAQEAIAKRALARL